MATREEPVRTQIDFWRILHSRARETPSPRLGKAIVKKSYGLEIKLDSPGMLTSTSRGLIPHLTQDHVGKTDAIKWVHVPFETFLERSPPIPTLIGGEKSLQTLLGFRDDRHVLSMSLRDPLDVREMPSNGNKFINANCIRGVRKMTPEQYRLLVQRCNPDLVVALSDIPFTPPPFSQRRITKSLERSSAWLASLLHSTPDIASDQPHPSNILVQMVGDVSDSARRAFAESLRETLVGKDAEQIKSFKCLDDAVLGYVFDLIPLRTSLLATEEPALEKEEQEEQDRPNRRTIDAKPLTQPYSEITMPRIIGLLNSSLEPLSPEKPRIVTGASSPHEILRLIRDVGIDFFDVAWAQKAADWGVALDFVFPARSEEMVGGNVREDGKRDLGHNIYSSQYATDFSRLSDCFQDGASVTQSGNATNICPCVACSPTSPSTEIVHSSVDVLTREMIPTSQRPTCDPPFTRAYIHHLLHTHEMSAHALLAAHNLTIADAFLASIRQILARGAAHSHHPHPHPHPHPHAAYHADIHPETEILVSPGADADFTLFDEEVERFCAAYDGTLCIFNEAKRDWIAVDYARGKGRLAREKAKQGEEDLTTKPEKMADIDETAEI